MWKNAINQGLRSLTGHELRRAARPEDVSPATVRELRERNGELREELRTTRRQLRRKERAEERRKERVAARGGGRGTLMPAAAAQRALADLEGMPDERLSLTDIANLEGTDKGTVGPSPTWPAHNYTDVYGAYLAPWRDRELTILEIGLGVPGDAWEARIAHGRNEGGGASLRTWYRFFPKARIYGADINPAPHLDNDRISTHVLDQGDPAAISAFLAEIGDVQFDLIVDDGSHKPDHQQVSFGCLFDRVRPGGLYIIEDLVANGVGDGREGRRATSSEALNTRKVFHHFRRHGEFPQPHKVGCGPDTLAQIESVTFHVPRRPAPHAEGVVVIRKAS